MSETQLDRIEAKLDALLKGVAAAASRGAARSSPSAGSTGGGLTFPNYGRSKGMPVRGASLQDLRFYRSGCERTLNDESKSRWHERERALLAAIDEEIARQDGTDAHPPPDDGPPPDDIDPF